MAGTATAATPKGEDVKISFSIKGWKADHGDALKTGLAGLKSADCSVDNKTGTVEVTVKEEKTISLSDLRKVVIAVNKDLTIDEASMAIVGKVTLTVAKDKATDCRTAMKKVKGVTNCSSGKDKGTIMLEAKGPKGVSLSDLQAAAGKAIGWKEGEALAISDVSWTAPKKKAATDKKGGDG